MTATVNMDDILRIIGKAADKHGLEAYIVGGFVRDKVMGIETKDLDIMVLNDRGGIQLAEVLHKEYGFGKPVLFPRFQTAQTRYKGVEIEMVAARTERYQENSRKPDVKTAPLEEDIYRRDFTINTLIMSLNTKEYGTIMDITGKAKKDIKNKLITTPTDPQTKFEEDPLRMLRAIRFACQLGFGIAPDTLSAIKDNKDRITIISAERIRDELEKIILSDHPKVGYRLLEEVGLLALIDPELHKTVGFEQEVPYHHEDVFRHTLSVLENAVPDLTVRLAALYHDLGKVYTKQKKGDRYVYYNHEKKSVSLARITMKNLRFPHKLIDQVCFLIDNHMLNYSAEWSDPAIRRLVHRTGDHLPNLLNLKEADVKALRAPHNDVAATNELRRRIENLDAEKVKELTSPLNGNEIQEIMQIPASTKIGTIKKRLIEAVLNNEIENTKQAATKLIKKEFSS